MQTSAMTAESKPAINFMPKFIFGRLTATPGAMTVLDNRNDLIIKMIQRHTRGDWGDIDQDDKESNDHALSIGARLLSVYIELDTKFYVITEADRSMTTILLPEEY